MFGKPQTASLETPEENYKSHHLFPSFMVRLRRFFLFLTTLLILLASSYSVVSEDPLVFSLDYPSQVNESSSFLVTVTSQDQPVVNATVMFHGQTMLTNATGTTILLAPRILPGENTTFPLLVSKDGYNDTTVYITVLNVPQLFLTVASSYLFEVTYFILTVIDDNGTVVANATIRFNATTYYSDTNGTVLLATPHVLKTTDMVINATKQGYLPNTMVIVVSPTLSQQNLIGFLLVIGMCLVIATLLVIFVVERYLKHRRINRPR